MRAGGIGRFTTKRAILVVGVLLVVGISVATHFSVEHVSGFERADAGISQMQRMGPPPSLVSTYRALAADTVSIERRPGGSAVATGVVLGRLTGQTDFLVAAPFDRTSSVAMIADVSGEHLDATVVEADRRQNLVLLAVNLGSGLAKKLVSISPLTEIPDKALVLGLQVVLENPQIAYPARGFVVTSAHLATQHNGISWCGAAIHHVDDGAPIAGSANGPVFLVGLAQAASTGHRCVVHPSWGLSALLRAYAATPAGLPFDSPALGATVESSGVASLQHRYAGGQSGALVASVTPGGSADRAGMRASDVVWSADGTRVDSGSELLELLEGKPPGADVALSVYRGSSTRNIEVKLD